MPVSTPIHAQAHPLLGTKQKLVKGLPGGLSQRSILVVDWFDREAIRKSERISSFLLQDLTSSATNQNLKTFLGVQTVQSLLSSLNTPTIQDLTTYLNSHAADEGYTALDVSNTISARTQPIVSWLERKFDRLCIEYSMRTNARKSLPKDDEVVLCIWEGREILIHNSEIEQSPN